MMARSQTAPNGREVESVWDYPRPPTVQPCDRHVTVSQRGQTIAESDRALRVLETAGPPTIYVPPEDVHDEFLSQVDAQTHCEWKGDASYFDVVHDGGRANRAAWTYRNPKQAYEELRDYVSFYPRRVDCHLDDEKVRPQPGAFYGGWMTDEIEGPFKGEPGSEGW